MSAGAIADVVGSLNNTLSSHLGILARVGLIRGYREGRMIIYRAEIEGMHALMTFLITECCDARPELCNLFKRVNEYWPGATSIDPSNRNGKKSS
jgi:DNA-binding transcriptional ArsR family regulator